jgi:hypothetical protein
MDRRPPRRGRAHTEQRDEESEADCSNAPFPGFRADRRRPLHGDPKPQASMAFTNAYIRARAAAA